MDFRLQLTLFCGLFLKGISVKSVRGVRKKKKKNRTEGGIRNRSPRSKDDSGKSLLRGGNDRLVYGVGGGKGSTIVRPDGSRP